MDQAFEIGNLAQIISASISVATLIYVVITARQKASADKVAALESALIDIKTAITGLTTRVNSSPDRDTTHRIELAIAKIEGRMETMDERMKPIATIAVRLQEMAFQEAHNK